MHVTQCLVRDGLGWSEQGLINEEGCPQVFTTSKIIITVVITILFAAHTIVHVSGLRDHGRARILFK